VISLGGINVLGVVEKYFAEVNFCINFERLFCFKCDRECSDKFLKRVAQNKIKCI